MSGTIKHYWTGTVLTIESDSGTSSCDLKGATGDTGIRGPQGIQGEKGEKGAGEKGDTGAPFTYDMFTPEQLAALTGPEGPTGKTGETGAPFTYDMFTEAQLESLRGPQGIQGKQGIQGEIGPAGKDGVGIPTGGTTGQILTKASAADYDTKWAAAASGYAYNLLDNSDFRNPVNQRGVTSETSVPAYSYFIDRWVNQSNVARSFTLSTSGIGLSLATTLLQKIEKIEAGKIVTFAIKLSDGTLATLTGTVQYTSDDSWTRFASKTYSFGDLYLETMNGSVHVVVYNTEAITIAWAALYEGTYTAETLPPYVPKGYAAELAECRQYYRTGTYKIARPYTSGNLAYLCEVSYEIPMRANPNVSIKNVKYWASQADAGINATKNISDRFGFNSIVLSSSVSDNIIQFDYESTADM